MTYVWIGSDPMYYFYTDYAWYYDAVEEEEDVEYDF